VSRPLRCVLFGFDSHRALPVRAGVEKARELYGLTVEAACYDREALLERSLEEAAALARAADAVFVASLADDAYLEHARVLAANCERFYPSAPNTLDIAGMARVPGLRLDDPAAMGVLAQAAGAMAAAGKPVPPFPGLIATVLPQVAHLLPAELTAVRSLGRVLQAMLNLSPENVALAFAAIAAEQGFDGVADPGWPEVFPACGFWHPRVGLAATWPEFEARRAAVSASPGAAGRVLLVVFSTQVTSGNHAHLDALIEALEREGLDVVPWFGALDAAGRVDEVLQVPGIDLVVNASGFTLTGTHGQPNVTGDVQLLSAWDVPQVNAVPLLFQTVESWLENPMGLAPMAMAMQVAVPELEAALAPRVLAGRTEEDDRMEAVDGNLQRIARHARRLVELRKRSNAEKRVAIILFCVPPDGGAVGTAAYLDVFASLHALLERLRDEGYGVEVPASAEALLEMLVNDEAGAKRTGVAIADWYPAAEYARGAPELERVSRQWGPAPGDVDTDGVALAIRGVVLGNVAILVQPDNGGYTDPIGLLYSADASPSHSFTALYDWVARRFRADVILHFGTHGALEFMPGKQAGLLASDFPDALIGDTPHVYYYCMNNPAEAAIARRRSASEIVSYLSPPVARAGLYGALEAARDALLAAREEPADAQRFGALRAAVEAAGLDTVVPATDSEEPGRYLERVSRALDELEQTLIPLGLHVLGRGIAPSEAIDILSAACEYPLNGESGQSLLDAVAAVTGDERAAREAVAQLAGAIARGEPPPTGSPWSELEPGLLARWHRYLSDRLGLLDAGNELDGLVRALSGRYIPPSPGGDPVREPDALPTGRGLVALDPYRVPTLPAIDAGTRLADELVQAALRETGSYPETIGVVLWGLETIKARGEAIAQVLRLIGVRPAADSFGRVTRFEIVPLDELGRPRIDVLLTVSGIFRDLFLPSTGLLDRAFRAVAELPEPPELNYVRKHVLEAAERLGVSFAEASARVFSQRAGRYGTGVNDVVLSSQWEDADQLAEVFSDSMAFAYGERHASRTLPAVFRELLGTVETTFQNVDSTEVSLSDVDHYFEYLGGLTNAARAASGKEPLALVADTFRRDGRVRTLREALWLETKTRLLNPKWQEALLEHGYSGVAQVATRLDNTFGWSATTSAVDGRLFAEVAETYLLDDELRERMARENPLAVRRMGERLIEAARRGTWDAPTEVLERLETAVAALDDAIEGVALHAG
jgi:magnesium chelatase subunit H